MIALDTNLIVYAHRPESPWHARSVEVIDGLWSGRRAWGIPVPCLVEFAAAVSNRRLWKAPSQVDHVADQVAAWTESPSCRLLACLAHGVTELWTADRDYTRFPALRVRNPLVE